MQIHHTEYVCGFVVFVEGCFETHTIKPFCTGVASSQTKWHNIKINHDDSRKLWFKSIVNYYILCTWHIIKSIFNSCVWLFLLWIHSRNIKFAVNNFHHNQDAYFISKCVFIIIIGNNFQYCYICIHLHYIYSFFNIQNLLDIYATNIIDASIVWLPMVVKIAK